MDNLETKDWGSNQNEEISAKEVILRIQSWFKYILSKWLFIMGCIAFGLIIGFFSFKNATTTYSADCTFTLDEGNSVKGGSSGGLALLGIGGTSEGGLFQGKNLIWLYSSRQMIEKALLTPVMVGDKKELYLEWFLSIDKKAKKLKNISNIKFPEYTDSLNLSVEQNGLLSFAIGRIREEYLSVSETKNSENFITVNVKSQNELFAKEFSDVIVKTVNDFYVNSKTKKIRSELAVLELKTQGYQGEMNNSMYQTASAYDATPYPNPNQQILQVNAEKKGVGVKINSELYIQMVKQLEQSKIDLAKETPLIQVIDEPVLPLATSRLQLIPTMMYSFILSVLLSVLVLTLLRVYKSVMNS